MANVSQKIDTFLGGVSRKADFDKTEGQVVEANNCYPDETYGMMKRPGTELLGTLGIDYAEANDTYFFPIIREGQPRYVCGIKSGSIKMWSIDDPSVAITVNAPGGTSYLNYTLFNSIVQNDAYRAASDDRRTIIVNRTKVCAENTTLWSTGVDSDGNGSIDPFTWTNRAKNRNANSIDDLPDGRCVRIHVTNGGNASSSRPLREGVHYLPVTVDDVDSNNTPIVTEGSGLVIKCRVNASGFIDAADLDGCEVWAAGSGYPDQCPASIDGIPGSRVTIATGLRPAMVYRVVNSNADHDDMYLQAFSNETTSDDFPGYVPGPRDRVDGPYLWKECPSPDSYVGIDPATLPHELIQVNNTTFTFQPVDYSYRWAGDNTNNPAPSFIGSTINNTFFMNNRLGFLSEDNVILSRPINYGPSFSTPADYVPSDNPWVMRNYTEIDFFRQSAIGLNDADPIDIKAANNNTSIFHTAISTPQGTILFADGQQSLLFQPQGLLSPLTASINSLSNYDMTGDINAVIIGEQYYFVNKSTKFCRIYSMINQGMQNPPVIEDVTYEVADWLPNDMTDLVACPTDKMIFAFNRTRGDVYVRRDVGESSAWVKWKHAEPVVSLIVDHDLIFFLTSSVNDIEVSVARLYLLPDDYTLGESLVAYDSTPFTSIPADYNYYNNIIGDTLLNDGLTGVLEYYKPWHGYYGDLSVDNTLNDTFDQWLPWEDTGSINALISISANELVASQDQPWNVGFKATVRTTQGNSQFSPLSGEYILPYDTKFRIRNNSGLPDSLAYNSTVNRCDTSCEDIPIHTGNTPPPFDKVRFVGTIASDGNSTLHGGSSGSSYTSPWFTVDSNFTTSNTTGYSGTPYLSIGGVAWRHGGSIYHEQVVDHLIDAGNHPMVDAYTPYVNYRSSYAPDANGNTTFGSYANDGLIGVPWRSSSAITTNDALYSLHGNKPWYLGGLHGQGFTGVPDYGFPRSFIQTVFFVTHTGTANTVTSSSINGYWEFEKDGAITRWGGFNSDGTPKTLTSPCSVHTGTTPPPYDEVRYVGRFTTTDSHPISRMTVNGVTQNTITTNWIQKQSGYPAATGYQGDPYLYVGGVWAKVGTPTYNEQIVDHYFDPASNNYNSYGRDVVSFTPWVNYASSYAPDNNGNIAFGNFSTTEQVSIPWRSKSKIVTTNPFFHSGGGGFSFGDLGGWGHAGVQPYARGYSTNPPDFFNCAHYGRTNAESYSEIDGYWEFRKDGIITRWAGYDEQGNLRTDLSIGSPCNQPFDPNQYSFVRYVGQMTNNYNTTYTPGSYGSNIGMYLDSTGRIETNWKAINPGGNPLQYFVGSAYASNPLDGNNNRFVGDFMGASPFTDSAGTLTFPTKSSAWRANITVTNTGNNTANLGNIYIGDIGSMVNGTIVNHPNPDSGGAFGAGDFRATIPLLPSSPNPAIVTINGRWEFSNDGVNVATSWGGLTENGDDFDQSNGSSDECCNDIWITKTDGTEFNTGIRAKSFELIPNGDNVIIKYVPCNTADFDPTSYFYGRFVGKATLSGVPGDATIQNKFEGSWIDSAGNIQSDWIQFGSFMNLGGVFSKIANVGGYVFTPLDIITDPDGGPLNQSYNGKVLTNTWTPTVNYYDNISSSPTFGTQFGDVNNGTNGVKWRNTMEASVGYIGANGWGIVYFGGIYTGPGLTDWTGSNWMNVVLDGEPYYTTSGAQKDYTENRVGTISGRWEFTNDRDAGPQVTWGGVDANGVSSTDFEYTQSYPASTFKTAYLKIVPTTCCPCPTEPIPTITLNTLSLDPNLDLYTANVSVAGTLVTPSSSFPKLTSRTLKYVIANLPGQPAVASDRAGDTGTLTWNSDHSLTADRDLTGYANSLIIGYTFDYHLVLPTFYFDQAESDYDYTASLTVSRVKFALGLSGQADFQINVKNAPGWQTSYSQVISNEYLASTVPLTSPTVVSVPVHKRNSDFKLQVRSDSPFPLSVDSCMWEGNYSPRYYRRF